ncbi:MAG TPA: histidine kinase dimerization/phospho-acceptor domain-containing protein, partial [Pseudohaliea sp.]|nr:histidine kinase dimerization/phospho-acceptor domain-containing protein [Pseudohaliea sp.]
MLDASPVGAPVAKANLRRLLQLRNLLIAVEVVGLAVAALYFGIIFPVLPSALLVGLTAGASALTWWRLRRPWPVTDLALLGQLLVDVALLTGLFLLTGGALNPFLSIYLLPLCVAAVVLPLAYTALVTLVTAGCYSWLTYISLPLAGQHAQGGFGLHLLGMWGTFVVSAVLVAGFVSAMARSLRERDRQLAAAREETLRNERIVALGTLAAGAAHEMATPLSTMAVVARELELEHADDAELHESVGILCDQIQHCEQVLSDLLGSAGAPRLAGGHSQPVDRFLAELLDKWRLLRPEVKFRYSLGGPRPAPEVVVDQTLGQAVLNLLNNAADASPHEVEIRGDWDAGALTVEILDRGPGLTEEVQRQAGE